MAELQQALGSSAGDAAVASFNFCRRYDLGRDFRDLLQQANASRVTFMTLSPLSERNLGLAVRPGRQRVAGGVRDDLGDGGELAAFLSRGVVLDQRAREAVEEVGLRWVDRLELAPGRASIRVLVRNYRTGAAYLDRLEVELPSPTQPTPALLPPLAVTSPPGWSEARPVADALAADGSPPARPRRRPDRPGDVPRVARPDCRGRPPAGARGRARARPPRGTAPAGGQPRAQRPDGGCPGDLPLAARRRRSGVGRQGRDPAARTAAGALGFAGGGGRVARGGRAAFRSGSPPDHPARLSPRRRRPGYLGHQWSARGDRDHVRLSRRGQLCRTLHRCPRDREGA